MLGVGAFVVALAGEELVVQFGEGVGDVLEKDEAEHDVLVFRSVEVIAELVGRGPERGLEPEVGGGVFRRGGLLATTLLGHTEWVPGGEGVLGWVVYRGSPELRNGEKNLWPRHRIRGDGSPQAIGTQRSTDPTCHDKWYCCVCLLHRTHFAGRVIPAASMTSPVIC